MVIDLRKKKSRRKRMGLTYQPSGNWLESTTNIARA